MQNCQTRGDPKWLHKTSGANLLKIYVFNTVRCDRMSVYLSCLSMNQYFKSLLMYVFIGYIKPKK